MDKKMFFDEIGKSLFNGRLSYSRRDGIDVKLNAFDAHGITDERWCAYMLATSYHETGGAMQPVEEAGREKGRPYGGKRMIEDDETRHGRRPWHMKILPMGTGAGFLRWKSKPERIKR